MRMAMSALGKYDLADDVTQNAFIKMFSKPREHLDSDAGRKAYLLTTVRTCVIDILRVEAREAEKCRRLGDLLLFGEKPSRSLQSTSRTMEERKELLLQAMKKLNDTDRIILGLYYERNLPVSKIAEIMNMQSHKVSTRKYRAQLSLKKECCPTQMVRRSTAV